MSVAGGAETERGWLTCSRPSQTKYSTSLREHTQTVTHMQKELESTRSAEKHLREKLRDMELDNDDLEKSER